MQLDQTQIAVHERTLLETMDLALHVARRYAGALAVTFLIGAIPLAGLYHVLITSPLQADLESSLVLVADPMLIESDGPPVISRYLWEMTLAVFLSAPLAGIFTTKFLGDAVFVERPPLRTVLSTTLRLFPRLVWCQLILRGVLPLWVILTRIQRGFDAEVAGSYFWLMMLVMVATGLRGFRPFINEIVLLECCPLLAKDAQTVTISRRSGYLHSPSSMDVLSRWLGSVVLAVMLTGVVQGCFLFCWGVFLNSWRPGPEWFMITYPIALWTVAWFMTVVRFLGYLDLRIRHEGWETELLLRAEAARLAVK